MPFVDIEDSRVEYHVDGHGPALVLVHGAGQAADTNWGTLPERMSRGRIVVRPNCSGSGATSDGGGPLTLERLGRQVVASAWAVGAVPFDLVGFSLGASVAAYVAATSPDLVRSVVLMAGYPDTDDPALRLRLLLHRDLLATAPETLARLMVLTGHAPDYLSGRPLGELEQSASNLVERSQWDGWARQVNLELGLDLHRVLPGIRCPALVIAGEHDVLVPPARSHALANAIPGARLIRVPAGHLVPLEQPEMLAESLQTFLADVERSGNASRRPAAPAACAPG